MSANKGKRKDSITLNPNFTMARAYLLMQHFQCDALPVESQGELVGVLSMKDIRRLAESYSKSEKKQSNLMVGTHMRSPVVPIDGSAGLANAIQRMLDKDIQAIIVKDEQRILGTLSRDNLLEILAELSHKSETTVGDSLLTLAARQLNKAK